MAISKARRNFRRVLLSLMIVSMVFVGTASYFYINTKNDDALLLKISPTLFHMDVLQHQARAFISNDDDAYFIAGSLYQKGVFSGIYKEAGIEMWRDLAEGGHERAREQLARFEAPDA